MGTTKMSDYYMSSTARVFYEELEKMSLGQFWAEWDRVRLDILRKCGVEVPEMYEDD